MVQRDSAWLSTATPEQVVAALTAGELSDVFAAPAARQALSTENMAVQAWVKSAPAETVVEALHAGRLDSLLGRTVTPAFPGVNDAT